MMYVNTYCLAAHFQLLLLLLLLLAVFPHRVPLQEDF